MQQHNAATATRTVGGLLWSDGLCGVAAGPTRKHLQNKRPWRGHRGCDKISGTETKCMAWSHTNCSAPLRSVVPNQDSCCPKKTLAVSTASVCKASAEQLASILVNRSISTACAAAALQICAVPPSPRQSRGSDRPEQEMKRTQHPKIKKHNTIHRLLTENKMVTNCKLQTTNYATIYIKCTDTHLHLLNLQK